MKATLNAYQAALQKIKSEPKVWLVTGVAGFIGSNLLEHLLKNAQTVVGLDNFSTGRQENLNEVRALVGEELWRRFHFIKGDISDLEVCRRACQGVDYILHQAALGSVPRSLDNPLATNQSNVTGFLNMLVASREINVRRLVYASSSSVYGDNEDMPKLEERTGHPLSPYAVTKRVNELYARVFHLNFGLATVGLRYFNVFGPRQNPNGPYAAVIPKWIKALSRRENPLIFGDGTNGRDFCYIKNVLQMNILAAATENPGALGRVFNVAMNESTSVNDLFSAVESRFRQLRPGVETLPPIKMPPRPGEILHSQADISAGRAALGYKPEYDVLRGLDECLSWYVAQYSERSSQAEQSGPDAGAIARDL